MLNEMHAINTTEQFTMCAESVYTFHQTQIHGQCCVQKFGTLVQQPKYRLTKGRRKAEGFLFQIREVKGQNILSPTDSNFATLGSGKFKILFLSGNTSASVANFSRWYVISINLNGKTFFFAYHFITHRLLKFSTLKKMLPVAITPLAPSLNTSLRTGMLSLTY